MTIKTTNVLLNIWKAKRHGRPDIKGSIIDLMSRELDRVYAFMEADVLELIREYRSESQVRYTCCWYGIIDEKR